MSLDAFLNGLRRAPDLAPHVVRWHREEAREGIVAPLPDWMPEALRAALEAEGLTQIWSHQREAADLARARRHVAVATPTASGKSLCYHLPVLASLLDDPPGRALYLFPTKALSRDQMANLARISNRLPRKIRAGVFDGDTPPTERRTLRGAGDIIVTNPYMLHSGVLPHHARWASLFRDLRYVVVDEMHTMTGVFGSHVANVLRRLRRIARHHGADPTFIFCSATIANPGELASHLIGDDVAVVTRNGAPAPERNFVLFNPPLIDAASGARADARDEAQRLAQAALGTGLQTIVFARSRTAVEVLTKYMRDAAERMGLPPDSVRGYRGGYLPNLRRDVEKGLRDGTVRCVVATNALELGIDIGGLDVVVIAGYPGRTSSARQQAGRCGRRDRPGTAVLVARSDPIDQYVMQHPEMIGSGLSSERAAIDPRNRLIFTSHVRCAAFELPFREGERLAGEEMTDDVLRELSAPGGILMKSSGRYHWIDQSFPADTVSLDGADIDNVTIFDVENRVILAEVDRASAPFFVHEGAIYGHQGDTYFVEKLDWDGRRAYVRKVEVDHYTEAEAETEVRVVADDETTSLGTFAASRGGVLVTTHVPLYKKIRYYTGENVGCGEISLPAEQMGTAAAWLDLSESLAAEVRVLEGGRGQALRGVASLLRSVACVFLRCDRMDLRVHSEAACAATGLPRIVVFDRVPGGVGLAESVFASLRSILPAMEEIVRTCACKAGCPACIGPPGDVGAHGKVVACAMLASLVRGCRETPAAAPTEMAPPVEVVRPASQP
ncbi:MAG: ATP-dependent RNA helicase DbpA [Planctomycetes bacterium]|nr:ATP-dependent RNA helicase DbpA [Planctomycetota bacterium]